MARTRIGSFRDEAAATRYFTVYDEAIRELPAPHAELDVATSFGTTRVYRFGPAEGEALVLLSGMSATASMWKPSIETLSERHRVFAIDTLGEPGRSVQSAPLRDQDDRAGWLDEVLAGLGLDGVHLVGASTGGFYAVNQAIRAPGRLTSLSVVDPTTVTVPFGPGVAWRAVLAALLNQDRIWRRTIRYFTSVDVSEAPEARLVLAGIREYRMRLPPQVRPHEAELRRIELPTLAVFAARSAVHNGPKAARRAREFWPHAEVELWSEATHYLRPSQQQRFSKLIEGFVSRHPSR